MGILNSKKIKTALKSVCLLSLLVLQACTNFNNDLTDALREPASVLNVTSVTTVTHTINNIDVTATSQNGQVTEQVMKISLNQPSISNALTNYCSSDETKKCACEMKWVQTAGGDTSSSFTRTKRIPVTLAQTALAQCSIDTAFWDEIPSGTVLLVRIVPDLVAGNTSGLNVTARSYKKGSSVTPNGDYLDDSLTAFRNVHRYSCFTKRKVKEQIRNGFSIPETPPGSTQPPNLTIQVGSSLCTGGAAVGSQQCPNIPTVQGTQNYYRNLYVTSDRFGQITSSNESLECPRVEEGIKYSSYNSTPSAERGKYWPLDSQFSLATSRNTVWNVPVSADSVLSGSDPEGDPNAASNYCDESERNNIPDPASGVTRKCLGWAQKPQANGSCKGFTDSNGIFRPTTRLRRYRVLYPPVFDINGKTLTTGAWSKMMMDEVYVADRLEVNSNTGTFTGNAIYGPKPCPFAWFDHAGAVDVSLSTNKYISTIALKKPNAVTTVPAITDGTAYYGKPQYIATNRFARGLAGAYATGTLEKKVNPEGWKYPNIDRGGTMLDPEPISCSATFPIVERQSGVPVQVRLATTNVNRVGISWSTGLSARAQLIPGNSDTNLDEIMIRPIDPWTPQYLEDTTFQACAPVSSQHVDPPLEVYMDAINGQNVYQWCAMSYPTQNPYWKEVNSKLKVTSTTFGADVVDFPAGSADAGLARHKTSAVAGPSSLDPLKAFNAGCTGTDVCTLTCTSGSSAYCPAASMNDCQGYLTDINVANRCDRTIRFSNSGSTVKQMPLQASQSDIKAALSADLQNKKIYSCNYSYHSSNPNLVGKSGPSSGCCGYSGNSPILQNLTAGNIGHLEPQPVSGFPDVRFCGNPVQ